MQEKFEDRIRKALQEEENSAAYLPPEGHEERFELRLLRQRAGRPEKRISMLPWVALAAAVVAGFIVAIVVSEIRKTNDYAEKARLSDISGEMAAVEEFYTEKLQVDLSKLNGSDPNIRRFLNDITRLEEEYKMLESTLGKNFTNEKVVQAMVSNYKYRLRLMEQLQKYIEIQNQINLQNHEQKQSS